MEKYELIKLKGTAYFGEGDIEISDEFNSYYSLQKIDLLKDWCFLLNQEYEKGLEKYRAENRKLQERNDTT